MQLPDFEEHLAEKLKDPKFKKAYEEEEMSEATEEDLRKAISIIHESRFSDNFEGKCVDLFAEALAVERRKALTSDVVLNLRTRLDMTICHHCKSGHHGKCGDDPEVCMCFGREKEIEYYDKAVADSTNKESVK